MRTKPIRKPSRKIRTKKESGIAVMIGASDAKDMIVLADRARKGLRAEILRTSFVRPRFCPAFSAS